MLDIFTKQHGVAFIFHGEIRYFGHAGQGGDGMMQDSPAARKSYTVAFNIQKEIATSKLNIYIFASITFKKVT